MERRLGKLEFTIFHAARPDSRVRDRARIRIRIRVRVRVRAN